MAQKPSIPKGTRDFSPIEVAKRNYIFNTIRTHFEKFGFQPIETPTFENSETLMGKYGEEGDRLIFKILDSGEYFEKATGVKFPGEKKMNFLILYLHYAVRDLFKVIFEGKVELDFKNLIASNYIEGNNRYFELDVKFKDFIKKYLLLKSDFFQNSIAQIKKDNEINPQDFDWYFGSFCKKELLNDNFLEEFYGGLKKEGLSFFEDLTSKSLVSKISEKALRYDLTVPFARYVVQHQNEIEFPFKRYQIQPVWRADRPQKGRFREFYQCDADVVGSTSLWQEVELVQLYDSVFTDLGLQGVTIKINNRKILSGIAEVIGASDKLIDFTVALDKLDKIGEDGVKKEMLEKGISEVAIQKVQPLFSFTGTIEEKIEKLAQLLASSEEGLKGVAELRFICENVLEIGLQSANLDLDVTLARGLNYYTGAIFEVSAPEGVAMGSIGGGGRYDDLTGIFGLKNMSGVGISFGLDRIYLVIEELGLFPETVTSAPTAMFLNFGELEAKYAMKTIAKLRQKGIKVEMYPDAAKIAKQFQHADKRGIPFAVIVGADEVANKVYNIKNLASGEQQTVSFDELLFALK